MMSSVIPARLEFQCGHAALVSLPRVKGESSAQRTDRIRREKTAAQVRSCDFCPPPPPRLELVAPPPAAAAPVAPITRLEPPAAPVVRWVPPVRPVAAVPVSVAPPVSPPTVAAVRVLPASTTPTVRRVGRPRRTPAPDAQTYRFVVRFQTETVVRATDIRAALRQAESLGATEVLAVISD